MLPISEATKNSASQRRKIICKFCNIPMSPITKLEQNKISQKWKFKCGNCGIEFVEWV